VEAEAAIMQGCALRLESFLAGYNLARCNARYKRSRR